MDNDDAAAGHEDARLLLSILKGEIRKLIKRLSVGEAEAARDVPPVLRDLLRAMQSAVEQEAKLEKLKFETGAGGGALDLDAARFEIGRRLACLRQQ